MWCNLYLKVDSFKYVQQYIPWNVLTLYALFCFYDQFNCFTLFILSYPSGLLHWHWGNHRIVYWIDLFTHILQECFTGTGAITGLFIGLIYLPIFFRSASLALGQSQDCLLDWFIYPYSSGVLHWHWANHRIALFKLFIYPYPSGLLHWQWGNHKIAPVPVKQSWMIWVNELKLVHNTWDAISILVKYFEFEFVCEIYSPYLKFTVLTSWTILLSIHLPEL